MFKKSLVILLVIVFTFGSFQTVFANEKKLKNEINIKPFSKLSLKKGTIIRTSCLFAYLNTSTPSKLATINYKGLFISKKRNIVIQLTEDLNLLFPAGGFYTNQYTTVSDYLGDIKKIGYKTEDLEVHLLNYQEVLRITLDHSDQLDKYKKDIASKFQTQISKLKKEIDKLKK